MPIQWCDACFDQTLHFTTVNPGRIACRACRSRIAEPGIARPPRAEQIALTKELKATALRQRRTAREQRQAEKLQLEAKHLADKQAARIAARYAARWCPRCCEVTERVAAGRQAHCGLCKARRGAERIARVAALRASASPRISAKRHIANPQAGCLSGHHNWTPRGHCRTCLRLKNRHKRSAPEQVAAGMWKRAKSRALAKGRLFDISLEDCRVPAACPVFGPFVLNGEAGRVGMGPSLDRIDSTGGYTPENVIVISGLANTIKGPWTRQQLRAVVDCDAIWPK